MLRKASTINGYAIAASDGRLGTVSDFLFDDASWMVRWLVVDTGNWLSGRKVLLPPLVLGHPDPKEEQLPVRLTKQQVKDSPEIDTERPVSRQIESNVYDHYGWAPYWGMGLMLSASMETRQREQQIAAVRREEDDPHLRSIKAVTGYHIDASDGEIGHVEDFLMDDTDWSIHYLIVDTKNWWPGKKVLISPRLACEIDWKDKQVHLHVDRLKVKASPEYDASTMVDRTYEKDFHGYYGEAESSDRLLKNA